MAGVIGTRKFIYDMWGDTVNLASRMESHGVPGQGPGDAAGRGAARRRVPVRAAGLVDVKGKGPTPTYFLIGSSGANPG